MQVRSARETRHKHHADRPEPAIRKKVVDQASGPPAGEPLSLCYFAGSARRRAGVVAGVRPYDARLNCWRCSSVSVATDPRWAEHRRKLADAQTARRMTLSPDEFEAVLEMRAKGRTFSYIQEEIGVCHDVIRRELAERGYSTAPVRAER
jgi:hypothetical protein